MASNRDEVEREVYASCDGRFNRLDKFTDLVSDLKFSTLQHELADWLDLEIPFSYVKENHTSLGVEKSHHFLQKTDRIILLIKIVDETYEADEAVVYAWVIYVRFGVEETGIHDIS